jgi:hypothetical protein
VTRRNSGDFERKKVAPWGMTRTDGIAIGGAEFGKADSRWKCISGNHEFVLTLPGGRIETIA